jgi:hypothetical protein
MSRTPYTASEQFDNLSRQDRRQDEEEENSSMEQDPEDPEFRQSAFDLLKDGMDDFKDLPKFMKPLFIKLAKKQASYRCRLLNNEKKLAELENALDQGEAPANIRFQMRYFEKRYTDIDTISQMYERLVESEKTRLQNQNRETEALIANRNTELSIVLLPITANSDILKENEINSELILDSLIETEFCSMLIKMEQDKQIKAIKKQKFEAKKELNNTAAVITNKQLAQLNKQIKSLQLQLKTKQSGTPKNSKGPTGKKKTGKPKVTNEEKKPKRQKRNGNTKGTSKIHQ